MWSSCKALKMSILTGFGFLAAVVVCCRGIFIVKLSEDATAKLISQTLEKMDFQLFNLTGKYIIKNSYIKVADVSANHLEGVETRVSFSPGGKMALTVHIRRMLCTVDVRGSLMMFVSVHDVPLIEFINSTLILHITVGTSGESSIAIVTYCNMTVTKADVTSEHWAINIAKIKIVPKLTSGSHVSDKLCPHIEEKLLGHALTLTGLADSSWIEMNKVNVSIRVADRGVVGNHLYVVYQETENLNNNVSDWQRDLVLRPMASRREMELYVDRRLFESSLLTSVSEYENYTNDHLTLTYLEKHFTALGNLRLGQLGYRGVWNLNMDQPTLQTEQGKIILAVETTLSFNITSTCAEYTLLTFNINIEATLTAVARNRTVLFYIDSWREQVKNITTKIGDVTDVKGLASEFKLYEMFHSSEGAIYTFSASSLIPSRLVLNDVALLATENYIIIQSDLDLLGTSGQRDAYERRDPERDYDVSEVNTGYEAVHLKLCGGTHDSSADGSIIISYIGGKGTAKHNSAPSVNVGLFGLNCIMVTTYILFVVALNDCQTYFS